MQTLHRLTLDTEQGPITIRGDDLVGTLDGSRLEAIGHVVVTRGNLILSGDRLHYDRAAGAVELSGSVHLQSDVGIIDASTLRYDLVNQIGAGAAIEGEVGGFHFRATRFQLLPPSRPGQQPIILIADGAVTSCTFDHPDYLLAARFLRLQPRSSLRAQDASIWLFGKRILGLPALAVDLRPRRRHRGSSPLPSVGFDGIAGPFLRWRLAAPLTGSLDLAVQPEISTRMGLTGSVGIENSGGLPASLIFARREEIPRYRYPRLTVDRLPELKIRGGKTFMSSGGAVQISAEGAAGRYHEYDTHVSASRWIGRTAALWTAPPGVAHPILAAGLTVASYPGSNYEIFGSSLGYQTPLRRNLDGALIVGISTSRGRTPFVFDRLEAPRTIDLRFSSNTPRLTWSLDTIYDISNSRLNDAVLSYARTLRCIRPSLGFRFRSHQFLFGLTIPALEGPPSVVTPRSVPPASSYTWGEGSALPNIPVDVY